MSDLQAQIRQFCSKHHLRLNTDLGQHFLIDQHILNAILEAAHIQEDDHIVEIGPGIGILTKELLQRSKSVTAIELDKRIIPLLKTYVEAHLRTMNYELRTVNENALNTPMPNTPYKVVANIPYHITSPLLRHAYLESQTPPTSMTLLIQKEVANRICDMENTSLLTIVVSLFGAAQKIIDVPPTCFLPPPKVDSAVVHIDSHTEPIADQHIIDQVLKFAKIAFSQKRKMLKNTFSTFPGGMDLLKAAAIDENRRPQTLSIGEWIALGEMANGK